MINYEKIPHIAVIEDEEDIREEIVEELISIGYHVTGFPSGASALKAMPSQKPDLIVCDVMMPGLSGYEVLAVIRQDHPLLDSIPFIFLTALDDRESLLKGLRSGADDFLTKPVDFDILDAAIRSKLSAVSRILNSSKVEIDSAASPPAHLSPRETEVLKLLALGMSVSEIAEILQIASNTAGQYKKSIYSKLNIKNRSGATMEAVRRNLVSVQS